MAEWTLDLKKYAEKQKEKIDTVRKKVATYAYTNISVRTPVKTGRARGNWQIGINQVETSQLDRKGISTNEEIPKLNQVKEDETIYISNNLPYIQKLEYGSSKQAPSGMVGVTFAELQNKIEKFVKE